MTNRPTRTPEHWNQRYLIGDTPWDSGIRSAELARVLQQEAIHPRVVASSPDHATDPIGGLHDCEGDLRSQIVRGRETRAQRPCRCVELGCGTGTNAVFLAQQGFEVTAIDCSSLALQQARRKADATGVNVRFIEADVCALSSVDRSPHAPREESPRGARRLRLGTFDFVFDRGCYHCVRRDNLAGFLQTLRQITGPGSKYLLLAGNANEQSDEGPPRVHEHEIRSELGDLFEIHWIREFRFEDPGGVEGPLGWSCWMTRRERNPVS